MADYVQCKSRKMGEYDPLWCVRPLGHAGEHNYVVARDSEVFARERERERTRPMAELHREVLMKALATEYGNGRPFYNDETRTRLGDNEARMNIDVILRAIERAGLTLIKITTRDRAPFVIEEEG